MKLTKLWGNRYTSCEEIVSLSFSAWLIALMMFAVTTEIMSRYVFNAPIKGMAEIVSFAVIAITFMSLAGAQREKAHISMDLFSEKLSGRRAGLILELVLLLLMVVTVAIVVAMVFTRPFYLYQTNSMSDVLFIPKWTVALVMPIGSLLLLVRLGIQVKEQITGILKHSAIKQSKELSDL